MKLINLSETSSSPSEMAEALRWISVLKPYMRQATVGKAKKYVAQLKYDMSRSYFDDPIHGLASSWYEIMLFIPNDVLNHLLQSREISFHADDEFDDSDHNFYCIRIQPSLYPPISTDIPMSMPPLVQKYLLRSAIDFREELKSMI